MQTSLKQRAQYLAVNHLAEGGSLRTLSDRAGVEYHSLRRWLNGQTKNIVDADVVQRVYETLTGKHLDIN